ncbi:hypothetical protein DYQ86_11765 [Acidobacteria bacterium AB60]|nr:hypothetical protein DYQ86_11765 [Acidobacteria bacterium AB60]
MPAPRQAGSASDLRRQFRQSYYDASVLSRSLELADIVKLSHQELPAISSELGLCCANEREVAAPLQEVYKLDIVCITRAAQGSLILSGGECVSHPGAGGGT